VIKTKWKSLLQRGVVEWLAAHPDVSKNELARRAGIDKAAIIKITNGEKDNLNGDSAIALAGVMGVSVEQLYQGKWQAVPAPAADVIDATTDVRGTLRMLSLNQLAVNSLNPRKAFDDDAIGELADSIAVDGVLQNLVVAPPAKDGRHVVIAGGRRQRALLKLVDQRDESTGLPRWDADAANIPCRILAGDEPRVRAIALIENLQRVELSPMEEAQAFDELQQLDPKTWTTAHIAETVHRTQRYVQQRIKFARDLAPKGQRLLSDGKITVEMARTLTMAPKKQQTAILARIEGTPADEAWSVGDIREQVTDDWIESDIAIFDKSTYTGETVADDDTGTVWFTDKKLFDKMQRAAAAAKAKALEAERAWVKLVDRRAGQSFNQYDYNKVKRKDLSETGAVVEIDWNGRVEIHDGLVKREAAGTTRTSTRSAGAGGSKGKEPEKPPAPPFTNRLLTHALQTKTEYLQDAIARRSVADQGDTAMCLAIIGLLGVDRSRIGLAEEMRTGPESVQGAHVRERLRIIFGELAALTPKENSRRGRARSFDIDDEPDEVSLDEDTYPHHGRRDDDAITPIHAERIKVPWFQGRRITLKVWDWLRFKTRDERVEIFSLLVADRAGFFGFAYHPKAEHDPFDAALAAHVGLDTRTLWRPDKEWLEASRKPRLEALARALRLDPIPKSTTQLRDALAARFAAAEQSGGEPLPPADEWVPPEMRILEKDALDQALALDANAVRQAPGRKAA